MAAIVFDLWYTLIGPEDFRPQGSGSTNMIPTVLGLDREPFRAYWLECFPERMRSPRPIVDYLTEYTTALGRVLTADELTAFDDIWLHHDQALAQPRQDVLAVLGDLAATNLKIGLLSNVHERETRAWPESPLSQFFDAVCFSHQIGYGKPDPEAYACVLRDLGVEPGHAVFVGDGASGELEGARRAGFDKVVFMKGFVAEYGAPEDDMNELASQADATIDRIGDLMSLLDLSEA